MRDAFYTIIALSALSAGCSFVSGTPDAQPAREPRREEPAAEPRQQVSPESKAWFTECSAHYDAFMSKWKPIDDEAKAVIAESKDAAFYVAAPKLAGQLSKTCIAAKATGWPLQGYAYTRGTGLALMIALAKLQLRASKGAVSLFNTPEVHEMVRNLPTTGDDFIDRNYFCLMAQNQGLPLPKGSAAARFSPFEGVPYNTAHWMTPADLRRFNERFSAITKDTAATLDDLAKQFVPGGGDVGRVKQVKKLPDGATSVVAKRVEAPYECQHTGNYQWNGVAFNDCTYVDRPAVEIYGFTVKLADLPPSDVKVGDFISFSGTVGGKAPSNVEMTDAKWDAHFIWSVVRNKKPVYELPRLEPCR